MGKAAKAQVTVDVTGVHKAKVTAEVAEVPLALGLVTVTAVETLVQNLTDITAAVAVAVVLVAKAETAAAGQTTHLTTKDLVAVAGATAVPVNLVHTAQQTVNLMEKAELLLVEKEHTARLTQMRLVLAKLQ